MTPLRKRMIDAMDLRGFQPGTQVGYLRAISDLARHYDRSPELITDEEVRAYLLHLHRDRRLARTSVNVVSSAVLFLLCNVLGQVAANSPVTSKPQYFLIALTRGNSLGRIRTIAIS